MLVNGNIYAQGKSFNGLPVIWNYSISRNSWSPLLYPDGCLSDRVAIAVYQSRLLVIAAVYEILEHGRNMKKLGDKVFTLTSDSSWAEDVISPLPCSDLLLNMFACSKDKNLLVAWKTTESRVKLFLYDGHSWMMRDGPNHAFWNTTNILVCEQTVYLTNCKECPLFYKISLEELRSATTPKWIYVQSIPRDHSNLVSFCDRLTLAFKLTPTVVCILQYLSATGRWIELGDLDCKFQEIPFIVNVSNTRMLLIGQTKTKTENSTVEQSRSKVAWFLSPVALPCEKFDESFGTMIVNTEGMLAGCSNYL